MGCYLNGSDWPAVGKLAKVLEIEGARLLEVPAIPDKGKVLVCVVSNGPQERGSELVFTDAEGNVTNIMKGQTFDAAAVSPSPAELERFQNEGDDRPKVWLEVPVEGALRYADYDWREKT